MMFLTYRESVYWPSPQLTSDPRRWSWMEIGTERPIYLVDVFVPTAEIHRQFFFSDFGTLLQTCLISEKGGQIKSLHLIFPEHLTNASGQVMVEIAEVWAKPFFYGDLLYVTRDGQEFRFATVGKLAPREEMNCMLRINRAE